MDPTAAGLAFAVGAAGGWAALDVLRKHLARQVETVVLLWGLLIAQIPIFTTWVLFAPGATDWTTYAAPGFTTLLLNLYANWAFIKALEVGDLSRTIPMLSFTPALSTVSSAALVGEWPAPGQMAGIGLVVIGSGALAVGRSAGKFQWAPGTLLMLSVAFTWSASAAVDKVALQHTTVATHGLVQSCGLVAAVTALLVFRRRLRALSTLRPVGGRLLLAAAVMATASAFQYMAIQRTLVGSVETIKRAVGAGVALAVGSRLFGESLGLREVGAAALLVGGTALVLLAG